ncbi:MAG: sodium-dependent transporter [Lachnospiraceae bacterium]|nr:sodium-dependent transporter [Lachnospiraceae bacterium]
MNERETFGSRLGFLLVSAGCAIGIGNVWKFPYECGENGGAIFVLFYLLFLIIMGLPVLTMEFAVGRASRKSAVDGYKALEKPGTKWHLHGWVAICGCLLLMMYYTTVAGWMFGYFIKFLTGRFDGLGENAVNQVFDQMLADPKEMALWMIIVVVIGFLIVSGGVEKGVERITKYMMLALLFLIVLLAVHSLTLPGASEGVRFYLLPSIERAKEVGIGKVITAAMNQAFFTLSLGVAAMEIFGSYMSKDRTLLSESLHVVALDTFVALTAGLIIFPACFSYSVAPNQGPALIFLTLPKIFANMVGGRIWGSLFFLFMSFASLSTVTAVFENFIATGSDAFGVERKKAVPFCIIGMILLSLPCVFGYNIWQDLHLIRGGDVLTSEDFIVSNLLLPIGSLIYLWFCTTDLGWGFDNYLSEANTGKGLRISRRLLPYFRFILPLMILFILITGLI